MMSRRERLHNKYDHRCMAAKQRLTKGRTKARQRKMHLIARLLDLPSTVIIVHHMKTCYHY